MLVAHPPARSLRALLALAMVLLTLAAVQLTTAVTAPRADAAPAGTCAPVSLPNGGFEAPQMTTGSHFQNRAEGTTGLSWMTTATDNQIEYWQNAASAQNANGGIAIAPHGGAQWAEINATQSSQLYQDVATVGGQILHWGVWHRGRGVAGQSGIDSMQVRMGDTTTQTAQTPTGTGSPTISDGPNAWVLSTGSYTVPAGQTTTRFGFQSTATSTNDQSVGNFIDDVTLVSEPCVTTTKTVTNLDPDRGPGVVAAGDQVEYTLTTTNPGGPATATVLTDALPTGLTYVPGSLRVDGTAVTDAAGDDVGSVASDTVTVRLGTGATPTAGGTFSDGTTSTVVLRATVAVGTAVGTTITNSANTSYQWAPSTSTITGTPGTVSFTTQAPGKAPLACSNIYAVQGAAPRNVWQVDPVTGLLSSSGSSYGSLAGVNNTATINALGISAGGDRLYGVVSSAADANVRFIQEIDRAAGTRTRVGQVTIPTTQLGNVLQGAVNPRTGIYYFGGITGTTLYVYGFDPLTDTSLGLVGQGTVTPAATVNNNPGNNGDVAFDAQGNLFVLAAGTTQAIVQGINEQLPTMAGAPVTLTAKTLATISDPSSTTTLAVGLAVGGQGDRRLYVAGPSSIRTVNPSTGAVVATTAYNGAATTGVNDLASCASPNTIEAQVAFPTGRVAAGDQATVTITGGSVTTANTGTTTGADTGLQDTPPETAGPVLGLDNQTYTATQTGITTPDYRTTYSCTNRNTGAVLVQGTGRVATFTMASNAGPDGTAAYCLFTNTVLLPAITLDKQAGTPSSTGPGGTVPYTFLITNTGNVDLSSVSVSDAKIPTVSCPTGTLAAGATRQCTGTYTLTQTDVNAGQVVNTATATGVSAVSGLTAPDPTATDTHTLTVPRPPTANPDAGSTPQDVTVTLTPATNDTPGPDNAAVVPASIRLLDPATGTYGTGVTIAAQGTYTVAASGAVAFDPVPTFVGTATPVTYRVADANGATATSTITITTTAVTPQANPDARFTPYDTGVAVDVVANDTAGEASSPLVPGTVRLLDPAASAYGTSLTVAGQGTYTVATTGATAGTVTFVPLTGFSGAATSVTYRVADDNATTTTSTLTVTVGTAPTALPDTRTTRQDVDVTINPLANDTASQNATITPSTLRLLDPATGTFGTTVTVAGQGTYTADAAGAVLFDPVPTFTGTATAISYRATDSTNALLASTITVSVTPLTPTAVPDAGTTPYATATTLAVVANDTAGDPSAPLDATSVRLRDPATNAYATSVTIAGQGTYAVDTTTGAVTFTPAVGYSGTTTPLTYRVADDNGTTTTATLTVTVRPGPSAAADARTTAQNVTVAIDVLGNDTAGGGASIVPGSVVLTSPAATQGGKRLALTGVGVLSVGSDGVVTFDPEPGFTGTTPAVAYRFTDSQQNTAGSTVTVSVTPVVPDARDDSATTPFGTATTVEVLDNDIPGAPSAPLVPSSLRLIDPGTGAAVTTLTVADRGTWVANPDGSLAFFPVAGSAGRTVAVTYRILDANGTADDAVLRVGVDLPAGPSAARDERTTGQDTTLTFYPLANDAAAPGAALDPTSVLLTGPGTTNGGRTLVVADVGTFTVDAQDGAVTFDPVPTFTGSTADVAYSVADQFGQRAGSVLRIAVTPIDPVATDDTATTPLDRSVGVAVLANDRPGDPSAPLVPGSVVLTSPLATDGGKTLAVTGVGTFRVGPQGGIVFTPESGFRGLAGPVTYRVSDENGTTATAQLTVTIGPAPTARPDDATTLQDRDVVVDPLVNDDPGAGATLVRGSVQVADPTTGQWTTSTVLPGQGTVTVGTDGLVTFDPLPGFTGSASVTYRVADTDGAYAASTITVQVTPVPPRATDDSATTPYGAPVTIDVLTNDEPVSSAAPLDPDSVRLVDPASGLLVSSLVVAGQGTWTVRPDGRLTFTPLTGFSGRATPVSYSVADTRGVASVAQIAVSVGAPPAVTANPDDVTGAPGAPVTVAVLTNDTAAPGCTLDPASLVLTSTAATRGGTELVVPGQGTWTVTPAGEIRFTPEPGFSGRPTPVAYQVGDSCGTRPATSAVSVMVPAVTLAATPTPTSSPTSSPTPTSEAPTSEGPTGPTSNGPTVPTVDPAVSPATATADNGILPNTGGPALVVLGLGLVLLLAGAWVLGRRRRA